MQVAVRSRLEYSQDHRERARRTPADGLRSTVAPETGVDPVSNTVEAEPAPVDPAPAEPVAEEPAVETVVEVGEPDDAAVTADKPRTKTDSGKAADKARSGGSGSSARVRANRAAMRPER